MIPRLLAITPGVEGDGRALTGLLEAMAGAGLRAVVLREPALPERALVTMVTALASCFGPGLILHSKHPDGARLAEQGGFGLHCAASVDPASLRSRIGGLLGASCHDAAALARARDAGCDYALISPVFSPGSKPGDARPTLGLGGLGGLVQGLALPVLALGGVTPERARGCRAAGAHGAAVMGGLFAEHMTVELREEAVRAYLAALG